MGVETKILNKEPVISRYNVEVGEVRRLGEVTPLFIPVAWSEGEKAWYGQTALASNLLGCWWDCGKNRLICDCSTIDGCSIQQHQGLDSLKTTPEFATQVLDPLMKNCQKYRRKNFGREIRLVLGMGAWVRNVDIYGGISREIEIFDETVDLGVWGEINSKNQRLFVRRNNGAPYGYSSRLVQIVGDRR